MYILSDKDTALKWHESFSSCDKRFLDSAESSLTLSGGVNFLSRHILLIFSTVTVRQQAEQQASRLTSC